MIKYALKCTQDHGFESWFQSAEAFAKLQAAGLTNCPVCGDDDIQKAVMAPGLSTSRKPRPARTDAAPAATEMHALTAPASPAEAAIRELKKKIQQHSEYVGSDFATEARAIHDGDAPERSIYGEAETGEAKKLLEDGIPVAPLPFMPTRKTN